MQKKAAENVELFKGMEALREELPEIEERKSPHLRPHVGIDDILEKVLHGEMQPAEADKWAREHCFEPFSELPREIDVFGSECPNWTVEMVAAWFRWKDPKMVMRHAAASYAGACVWAKNPLARRQPFGPDPISAKGHRLEVMEATSIFEPFIGYDGRPYSFLPHGYWQKVLFAHLKFGDIRAVGRENAVKLVCIPIEAWDRGMFVRHDDQTALLVDKQIYTQIEFASADVKALPHEPNIKMRPWKKDMPELTPVNEDLRAILQARSPQGFAPLSKIERGNLKEQMLQLHKDMKWDDDETFRRFLHRLIDDICEKNPRVPKRKLVPRPVYTIRG
ncbi:hypothetical protein [Sinorhizobium chiapasense]|uniref:Uncharacterized protein n=1 Tax=Sinorhizobium chiapasense TaxID=501572 RepID=A0ABZ2B9Q3_9HYPH